MNHQPLAYRMRPRTIDEVIGQKASCLSWKNHQSHGCGQTIIIHDFIWASRNWENKYR